MNNEELLKEIEALNNEYDNCSCHDDKKEQSEDDCKYFKNCIGCEYFY